MKIVGKIVVLAAVAALFVVGIVLVGKTNWADGVREDVQKARAARRAKIEAAEGAKAAVLEKSAAPREGVAPPSENPSANGEKNERSAEKVTSDKKPADASAAPKGPKGPKPPNFSSAAFQKFVGPFWGEILFFALVSGFVLALIRRLKTAAASPRGRD